MSHDLSRSYAVSRLLCADGTVNTALTDTLSVVFIGGSLTQGGRPWQELVVEYLAKTFPNATVQPHNAGLGGTGSEDGAIRFQKDALSHRPDIVFIEFPVNDGGRNEIDSKQYMESMFRQAFRAEYVPVIIGIQTPRGVESDHEIYRDWVDQVRWKGEVYRHYGIGEINIDSYLRDKHAQYCQNETVSYKDFLGGKNQHNMPYFHGWIEEEQRYDVHCTPEGYRMYARAILAAFEADGGAGFARMIGSNRPDAEVYCKGQEAVLNYRYCHTPALSDRFRYTDGGEARWYQYTGILVSGDVDPGKDLMHYFPEGVMAVERHAEGGGARPYFTFRTNADAIALMYPASLWGLKITLSVDGRALGTLRTNSIWLAAYTTPFLCTDIKDGLEHEVKIEVLEFETGERDKHGKLEHSDMNIFRYGYIIERYNR